MRSSFGGKNMRPYSQEAHELKLGLEAGVVERDEIVDWADRILCEYDYDDDVANLAMGRKAADKELMILLGAVIDRRDEVAAMRRVMGRMSVILRQHPERAHEFTRFLENFWIQQGYDVPDDMSFLWGIEDEFALAQQGVYGTVEEVTESLLTNLARYETNTEHGEGGKASPATS
jgi:hypothetical protein